MSYVLNAIYLVLMVVASPWLLWRRFRWSKNRRGWLHKLFGWVPTREPKARKAKGQSDRPCIWFHAVSVGEVNLLAPIIDRLMAQAPEIELVISTTTETGFDLAKQKYASGDGLEEKSSLLVFFFPFDFTWAIRNAIKRVRPTQIVLAELEMWPNFLRIASQQVPVSIVNGRLSEKSYRNYQRFSQLSGGCFRCLNLVMAQNPTYAQRFIDLGCDSSRVTVTGNVKFDGVETDRQNEKTKRLRSMVSVRDHQAVFLAGSTQLEEELIAARVFQTLVQSEPQLRLILAPRHPERVPQLIREMDELGLRFRLRSELNEEDESEFQQTLFDRNEVLVVDVIGELGAWWGVADIAYVGGSMGSRGGQNMLEPSAYGIPVSFGPNTRNFKEIVGQLLADDAATVVENEDSLRQFVEKAICDPDWARGIGQRAKGVVLKHDGAADKCVELLLGGGPSEARPSECAAANEDRAA